VRTLAAALASLLTLPAAAHGYQDAQVAAAARAAGFAHIGDRVAAVSRPTVLVTRRLLRRPPVALGTSRLGGNPDLPAGVPWPRCGPRTQTFLGQIRLRPVDAWRHLITFGVDFGIGFEVADGGRLQVQISPADLAAGRFDRVCGIFDGA
jgi:hypothetical protein